MLNYVINVKLQIHKPKHISRTINFNYTTLSIAHCKISNSFQCDIKSTLVSNVEMLSIYFLICMHGI